MIIRTGVGDGAEEVYHIISHHWEGGVVSINPSIHPAEKSLTYFAAAVRKVRSLPGTIFWELCALEQHTNIDTYRQAE